MAWPSDRVGGYDPDVVWDEDGEAWVAADGRGDTRNQTNIVVVGVVNATGEQAIYFGTS